MMAGLLAGMAEARERHGLTSKLILCFLRHLEEEQAFATLREAEPWLDRIEAVGLDSSELGHPPEKFARVFRAAGERGLKRVAHAGEEGPPDYVWQALDILGVDRLDHGNRAMEDPRLVERLALERMTLTVCPLSNHKLRVVDDMAAHPIDAMLAAGTQGDDQLRRSRIFRRLRERQLPRRGRRPRPRRAGDAGSEQLPGLVPGGRGESRADRELGRLPGAVHDPSFRT
jgi:hypothetical protein